MIILFFIQLRWVEQDPVLIWTTVQTCMNEVAERLKEKGFSTSDVKGTQDRPSSAHLVAIGVTNQRETSIVWDKVTGMPLFNAIGLPSWFLIR